MIKRIATVFCLGLAGFVSMPQAQASEWNKKTYLTVNETIQVPGAVLAPGKYVIKLQDSMANRNIVQVFNEREDEILTTVLAIPNYRTQPTGETELSFYEAPAGQAPALRSWFYPGDLFGQAFVYPKGMSVEIAKQMPAVTAISEKEAAEAEDESEEADSID